MTSNTVTSSSMTAAAAVAMTSLRSELYEVFNTLLNDHNDDDDDNVSTQQASLLYTYEVVVRFTCCVYVYIDIYIMVYVAYKAEASGKGPHAIKTLHVRE